MFTSLLYHLIATIWVFSLKNHVNALQHIYHDYSKTDLTTTVNNHHEVICEDMACNVAKFVNVSKIKCTGDHSCLMIVSDGDLQKVNTTYNDAYEVGSPNTRQGYLDCHGYYSCFQGKISNFEKVRCKNNDETSSYQCTDSHISNTTKVICRGHKACTRIKISHADIVICKGEKSCQKATFKEVTELYWSGFVRRLKPVDARFINTAYVEAYDKILSISLFCNKGKTCKIHGGTIVWHTSVIKCYGNCYISAYNFPVEEIPYSTKNSEYCLDWTKLIISTFINTLVSVVLWNMVINFIRVYNSCNNLLTLVQYTHNHSEESNGNDNQKCAHNYSIPASGKNHDSIELCVKTLCKVVDPYSLELKRTNELKDAVWQLHDIFLIDPIIAIIFDFAYGGQTLYVRQKNVSRNLTTNITSMKPTRKLTCFYVEFTASGLKYKYQRYARYGMILFSMYKLCCIVVNLCMIIALRIDNDQWAMQKHLVYDHDQRMNHLLTVDKLAYSEVMNFIMCFPSFTSLLLQFMAIKVLSDEMTVHETVLSTKIMDEINALMHCDLFLTCLVFIYVWSIVIWYTSLGLCILFEILLIPLGIAIYLVCWLLCFISYMSVNLVRVDPPPAHVTGRCKRCCAIWGQSCGLSFEPSCVCFYETLSAPFVLIVAFYLNIFNERIWVQVLCIWIANLFLHWILQNVLLFHTMWHRNWYDLDGYFMYDHLFNVNACSNMN